MDKPMTATEIQLRWDEVRRRELYDPDSREYKMRELFIGLAAPAVKRLKEIIDDTTH